MILPQFLRKFDYLFKEPDIKFDADLKMVAMMMSSLKLEPFHLNDGCILNLDQITTGIYFIDKGVVSVRYQNSDIICKLDDGSYFGEISYLFQVRNQYKFTLENNKSGSDGFSRILSIQHNDFKPIFDQYEPFYNLMKTRALRRQIFFKKIKNQHKTIKILKKLSVGEESEFMT